MELIFNKYHSIDNIDKKLRYIQNHSCVNEKWVVTEKVHGSNFSSITNGKEIKIACRTKIIPIDNNFYNAKDIYDKYQERIINLFNDIKKNNNIIQQINIFCELYGGYYPDTERIKTARLVQKEVKYCPYNDIYAFDISFKIVGSQEIAYYNYNYISTLFEKHNIPYAKSLFIGNLEECIIYSSEHNADLTTIPNFHNLPNIEGNIREGHVIKPIEPIKFSPKGKWVIIKDKNSKFREVKDINDVDEVKDVKDIENYITDQRLNNVRSKTNDQNFEIILNLFVEDVIEDFEKDTKGQILKNIKQQTYILCKRLMEELNYT